MKKLNLKNNLQKLNFFITMSLVVFIILFFISIFIESEVFFTFTLFGLSMIIGLFFIFLRLTELLEALKIYKNSIKTTGKIVDFDRTSGYKRIYLLYKFTYNSKPYKIPSQRSKSNLIFESFYLNKEKTIYFNPDFPDFILDCKKSTYILASIPYMILGVLFIIGPFFYFL